METSTAVRKTTESYAIQYLEDVMFSYLLERRAPAKVRDIFKRLEPEQPLGRALIYKVLSDSPRFVAQGRRWDLAHRELSKRPLEGTIEQILIARGGPMSSSDLAAEAALVRGGSPTEMEMTLLKILNSREKYFQTEEGSWGLTDWLLRVEEGDEEPDVFARNFLLQADTMHPLVDQLTALSGLENKGIVEATLAILEQVGHPVENKVLTFALWKVRKGDLDPRTYFDTLRSDGRLLLLSEAIWAPGEFPESVKSILERLSHQAEQEAEEAGLPVREVEGPIEVTEADLTEIRQLISEANKPSRSTELAEVVLELSPESKGFTDAVEEINKALKKQGDLKQVGEHSWCVPELIPGYISEVPEPLLIQTIDPDRFEDPTTDAELTDSGLEGDLANQVHDPQYEDFGEEKDVKVKKDQGSVKKTRYPLAYHHLQCGTMKLRQWDHRLFPIGEEIACLTLVDDKMGPFTAWANGKLGLLYNLDEWYIGKELVPGSAFTISQGSEPDEYLIEYDGSLDKLLALEEDRIAHLEELREPAQKEEWPIFDLMCRLMAEHRKGIQFLTLWAEVNVVRRTPRRVVASDLSSYHCFYRRPAKSGNWVFDDRRIEQGRKKEKKKYMRR